jgi:hypothetical protein
MMHHWPKEFVSLESYNSKCLQKRLCIVFSNSPKVEVLYIFQKDVSVPLNGMYGRAMNRIDTAVRG